VRGNLKTVKSIRRSGIRKSYVGTTSVNVENQNELSIKSDLLVQNQPNYIRKLYREIVDANQSRVNYY
jgi:hypothetical protein